MGKRGPKCTICSHRERAAIDLAVCRGASAYALGRRYDVGVDAIYRHARLHLSPALRARLVAGPSLDMDLDQLKASESESLLAHLVMIRARLLSTLTVAENAGDGHMVARIVSQLHRNLELTGKLLGELGVGSTTINNVLVLPAYVDMRVQLVRALQPFPEARQAVAQVLHQIESQAAADITEQGQKRTLIEAEAA